MRIGLRLESQPDSAIRRALSPGDFLQIGRSNEVDVSVASDVFMSSRHCAIELTTEGNLQLRDLGSSNGTFLNGARVKTAPLMNGDRVLAGESTFVVELHVDELARHAEGGTLPTATLGPAIAVEAIHEIPVLQIANDTPLAVDTLRWPDVEAKPKLTVVVKATFVIPRKGEDVRLIPKQLPVFANDIMTDIKSPSVRFESDLVPFKPCTDIVLVGRAYAPDGKSVTETVAGIRVGRLRYGVAVFGDRTWQTQLLEKPTISYTQPFLKMDLVYERAFGG